jgi:hypothetical protein
VKRKAVIRSGRIEDTRREFDVEFWQRLGIAAILDAAWDLVVIAHKWKGGRRSELRLQRVITSLPAPQSSVSRRRRLRSNEIH